MLVTKVSHQGQGLFDSMGIVTDRRAGDSPPDGGRIVRLQEPRTENDQAARAG